MSLRAGQSSSNQLARPLNIAQLRRPVAMALAGQKLFVANRRSGTISVLDANRGSVVNEIKVGRQLTDVVWSSATRALFAVDPEAGELIAIEPSDIALTTCRRLPVGHSPVSLILTRDGRRGSIANLWAHRLTFIEIPDKQGRPCAQQMAVAGMLDLPFAPRKQWLDRDDKTLVVADAFGGNLAIVDLATRSLRSVRSIQGHNIGGLAATPDGQELVITHQLVAPNVPTDKDHVFWGQVMGSMLRNVRVDHLLQTSQDANSSSAIPIAHWSLYPLGGSGRGAGDLGAVAFAPDGKEVVAVSGVNDVAIGHAPLDNFWRIPVGRNPTAITISDDGRSAYVANTFDDSISVIDLEKLQLSRTILLGRQPALSEADRGEILFHDATLCMSGWYSCNSCHVDGHTCGLLNDNHSDDTFATPKRVLSLMGVADTGPWAWNGRATALEAQVRSSLLNTMQGKAEDASEENINAITAYLRTLSAAPGIAAARGQLNTAAVQRGRQAFEELGCIRCHKPPAFTSSKSYDVGLRDEAGESRFNPPSLRGVSQLPAHFHNNRAGSLRDVFVQHHHPDGDSIPPEQLEDLLTFLQSI